MTLEEIKKYFGGGYLFWKKTGMAYSCYQYWQKIGYVPLESQRKIEKITEGYLKANLEHGKQFND